MGSAVAIHNGCVEMIDRETIKRIALESGMGECLDAGYYDRYGLAVAEKFAERLFAEWSKAEPIGILGFDAVMWKGGKLPPENTMLFDRPQPAIPPNNPAVAVIQYVLDHHCDSPIEFLNCWMHGDFDVIRREWENVPDEVFIGADAHFAPEAPK